MFFLRIFPLFLALFTQLIATPYLVDAKESYVKSGKSKSGNASGDYMILKKYYTDDVIIINRDLTTQKRVCDSENHCVDYKYQSDNREDTNLKNRGASNSSTNLDTSEDTSKVVFFHKVPFTTLHNWDYDDHGAALKSFLHSCIAINRRDNSLPISSTTSIGGTVRDWKQVCYIAYKVYKNKKSPKLFFETYFQPYKVIADGKETGRITGYYEIEMRGSLRRTDKYKYPIYATPPNIAKLKESGKLTRASINAGSLRNKKLEIAWVQDRVLLFLMHLQGSGTIVLPDNRRIRLCYAENNGFSNKSIHQYWQEYDVTLKAKNGLPHYPNANDEVINTVLEKNPSYVFFSVRTTPYVTGVLQVPLTPQRSVAVDNRVYPYGALFWLDLPFDYKVTKGGDGKERSVYGNGKKFRYTRMVVAQDRGGAMKGAARFDIFFGSGKNAGIMAHHMYEMGKCYALFPKFINIPKYYKY